MTPKEAYEARKAERAKLKNLDYQVKQATESLMMLDTLDRFVTAVERIADTMEAKPLLPQMNQPRGCVCPPGTEIGCSSAACPRGSFKPTW